MNAARIILIGLSASVISGCALPGLQYREGGSSVWKEQGNQSGADVQIKEITPSLTLQLAQDAFQKHQAKLGAVVPTTYAQRSWVYRVGVSDILSVIVWDHPELTNPAGTTMNVDSSGRVVRPDGTIYFPYAGDVLVADKTTTEIRELLTQKLARSVQNPQVDIKVLQYRSQFVNIVGDIDQPCKLPISDTPITVVDAMSQCKVTRAASAGANDNSLYAHRDIEFRRGEVRRNVDLFAIYKGQDPLSSQPLLGGDTIYLKDNRQNRVFVVGEVNRQAAIYIPASGLSLADALNDRDIGGLNQQTANAENIYVFRGGFTTGESKNGSAVQAVAQPDIFHLNVKSADALLVADQFQLQPRDVVFASAAPLVSYSRTAALIIPSISALLQTGILINATR
ncbi:polysaccharide biosynthesis/export family protein [Stenotrophobium rhamnosiphilum]|uniref:Polysaccharide export protein Wza n=1 Tax=Stenotrophobium rhamnosiphilum TaxID=2029166 RepID=A0A2T5MIE5_9GAMM|nr:polysaccharide biosynthesis/export family protein [Stenotrophobium rhamnosiphilum]PTU32357.1 hypothetical protein CJD38_06830 [Stenotrophobium rhamnosiphilum]